MTRMENLWNTRFCSKKIDVYAFNTNRRQEKAMSLAKENNVTMNYEVRHFHF